MKHLYCFCALSNMVYEVARGYEVVHFGRFFFRASSVLEERIQDYVKE